MDATTREVMRKTLQPQIPVKKMHQTIISIETGENPDLHDYLVNLIETADVTVEVTDYTTDGVVDYPNYYRAVYNQVKTYIEKKVTLAIDGWIVTDQPIVS